MEIVSVIPWKLCTQYPPLSIIVPNRKRKNPLVSRTTEIVSRHTAQLKKDSLSRLRAVAMYEAIDGLLHGAMLEKFKLWQMRARVDHDN